MKCAGKIAICLAGGLALNAGLRAADISADDPYAAIVTRNIFGLNPIPTVDPDSQPAPPVKITPNGIMTIFGRLQVLFKTAGGAGGKEQSYILTEGQRQDDIEIVKINEKAGIITFNNHGVMQELPLVHAIAMSTPLPAFATGPGGSTIPAANGNAGNGNDYGVRNGRFGNSGGQRGFGNGNGNGNNNGGSGNGNGSGDNSGADNGLNLRNIPTRIYQPEASSMTPEEQAVILEAQRAQYQSQGNPMAKLLPPPSLATQRALNGGTTPPEP
jgi:hypothetical protein